MNQFTAPEKLPAPFLLPVSGRDEAGLRLLAERYIPFLNEEKNAAALAAVCYTAGAGRSHFEHRIAVTGNDAASLVSNLTGWLSGGTSGIVEGVAPRNRQPRVAWLFTGQGSQYVGMGRQLYEQEPVFKAALDRCNQLFSAYHKVSLLDILYPSGENTLLINDTTYAQPAIFSLGWSLAQLWLHWGIVPAVLAGHSVGEYAAACVAGVFSLEDGMKLIVNRGRLMGALPKNGGMMNVYAGIEAIRPYLQQCGEALSVAGLNSPTQVVISGETTALDTLEQLLEQADIKTVRLTVSHAFHSGLMKPMMDAFRQVAEEVQFKRPVTPLVSLVSGSMAGGEIASAAYWTQHILEPVNFAGGIATLQQQGIDIYLETGPKAVLTPLGMQCAAEGSNVVWLHSLKKSSDGRRELQQMVAALYAAGCSINWVNYSGKGIRKVQLPTYPFQRSRYWVETADLPATQKVTQQNLLYQVAWELLPERAFDAPQTSSQTWLIFSDKEKRMAGITEALVAGGDMVHTIDAAVPAEEYARLTTPLLEKGVAGILYGRGLDITEESAGALDEELNYFLQLVQCLGAVTPTGVLRVITSGGLQYGTTLVNPGQCALCGMVGVMKNEMPQWHPVVLDVEEFVTEALPDIGTANHENICYRKGGRYVARLENIKPAATPAVWQAAPGGCYLISGGTGALGMAITRWLAAKGAGAVVLLSRSGGGTAEIQEVEQLAAQTNTKITIVKADAGNREEMELVFADIAAGPFELKGVIHAAGVLDDGLLVNQQKERLFKVFHAKAAGGWNLHALTAGIQLDFFICFSSAASLLGFAGQGNYAAANSYLEGLVQYRRLNNLPATVINWGPWKEAGMAAALDAASQARMTRLGVTGLTNKDALSALEYIISNQPVAAAVADINWQQYAVELPSATAFISRLHHNTAAKPAEDGIRSRLERARAEQRYETMAVYLEGVLCRILGILELAASKRETGFFEMGMDSLMAMELRGRLQRDLSLTLPATLAFNFPNLKILAQHLLAQLGWEASGKDTAESPLQRGVEPVAVIGMGCRFPGGADNPEAFWQLLRNGGDAVTEVPRDRWNVEQYYDADPDKPGKINTRYGAFIKNADQFDARFFGIIPHEADYMDPQQRLLLEVSWEALENAGIVPENLQTTATGVFVGIGQNDYGQYHLEQSRTNDINPYTGTGNSYSFAAGRVAYFLGTQGPAISIDTACSSSLVTVNMACQSLWSGESSLALAGGVQLMLTPQSSIFLSKSRALSPDGRCKTFSDEANGYVRGEGCGVVVLKRLSDAERDNDRILAVIRGAAVTHDGRSGGLTVPNGQSQEKLIRNALQSAGIAAGDISYAEAHGTGTALGDPIEMEALARTLAQNRSKAEPLLVGSVKTNIGHLEQAAGMAGLMKVILSLQHRQIPAHLHFSKPGAHIPWDAIAVSIPVSLTPWKSVQGRRIATVSAFGLSGTNAHLIVEEAPARPVNVPAEERPVHLFTLSAKSKAALTDAAARYMAYLKSTPDIHFPDVCFTTNTGRSNMPYRMAFAADNAVGAIAKLKDFVPGITGEGIATGHTAAYATRKLSWCFTGSTFIGRKAGEELFAQTVFREALCKCENGLAAYLHSPLQQLLWGTDETLIQQTAACQPALFALEYATAQLWLQWGVTPTAVTGNGTGLLVAACVAGIISLEDALKLVAERAVLKAASTNDLEMTLQGIQLSRPGIPLLDSNGNSIAEEDVIHTAWWAALLAAPDFFESRIAVPENDTATVYLHIGPEAEQPFTWHTIISQLAALYVAGIDIDFSAFHAPYQRSKVSLPTYPFQRKRHWNLPVPAQVAEDTVVAEAALINNHHISPDKQNNMLPQKDAVIRILSEMVNRFSGIEAGEEERKASFMELGLDSLVLVKLIDAIKVKFGVKLSMKQFFEELCSIDLLAAYLTGAGAVAMPVADVKSTSPVVQTTIPVAAPGQETDLLKKLDDLYRRITDLEKTPATEAQPVTAPVHTPKPSAKMNFKAVKLQEDTPFTAAQVAFIQNFIQRYNQRTAGSKAYAQEHRAVLADWINTIDFRLSLKELLYPIVSASSSGAHFKDIDGNDYLDIGLGYGVNFFGNSPAFVKEAIQAQLEEGTELATQTDMAGEVARLIQELTGAERVVFSNTGTEAVMAAIRIARTKTGKKKLVLFTGCYHGTFDGILAQAETEGDRLYASPIGPGIPQGFADDVLVLTLGAEESIRQIEQHAHEIAAVMVEPVQSRRPGYQPVEFLRQLREVTAARGIALIFDEIITGFRIHQGGAQAHFNIYADIVTYGKVPGGGMPVGIITGKKEYIDTIDGGWWQYGDDSYPAVEMTFFGGTFCKHPLTMAALKASLLKMKKEGPALQNRVNELTGYFAAQLNQFFGEESIPVKIVHFGSLFRFESFGKYSLLFQPVEMNLLFYLMMEKGVYTWERRICFFSTEHTYEDADRIIDVVKASVYELLHNGFFIHRELPQANKVAALQAAPIAVPLTDAQKQLWLLAELEEVGAQAYNISSTLRCNGRLNKPLLQKALDRVVARHEGLRTHVDADGNNQVVLPQVSYNIHYTDAAHVTGENRERLVQEWMQEGARYSFTLTTGPLFYFQLLQLSDEEFLLQFTAHHIVLDGWSFGVVLSDLSLYYNEYMTGKAAALPEVSGFRMYTEKLQQALAGETMAKAAGYWQHKLTGKTRPVPLPADLAAPAAKSYRAARTTRNIPAAFATKLKAFSREHACTPFMCMLTAYAAFLHRYCHTDELIIGIPVSGREEGDSGVVGYFANLLPFVSNRSATDTFAEMLKKTRQELGNCFEHQAYPFAKMLDDLNRQGADLRKPFLNVTFNINPVSELPAFQGAKVSWIPTPLSFGPFDLFFDITILPDGMVIDCDYNTDLFLPQTIDSLLENFEIYVNGLLGNATLPVATVALLPAHTQQQLVSSWNNTAAAFPHQYTITDLFEQQCRRSATHTAVNAGRVTLSFQQLQQQVHQLATLLVARGLKPGEPVGIYMARSAGWIVSILGILKAGGAYVPMEASLPASRLQFIAADAGLQWILTDTACAEKAADWGVSLLNVETPDTGEVTAEVTFPISNPDSNCYIIYTSGSTGKPKGCAITHRSLVNYVSWAMGYYTAPEQRINSALFTSLSFDFTATPVFCCLLSGGALDIYPETMDAREIMDAVFDVSRQYHFLKLTPAYTGLPDPVLTGLDNVAAIILGGEAVLPAHLKALRRIVPQARIYNEYGPTEATIGCVVKELQAEEERILIGKPIQNMQVYILDKQLQLVPPGVTGEICLSGIGLAKGYLNRDELTQQKFVPHPFIPGKTLYRTGDTGRWLLNGEIDYTGREDEQVKIRGFRVEPDECAQVLLAHEAVKEAVVAASGAGEDKELIAWFVTADNYPAPSYQELSSFMAAQLPYYMVPARFVELAHLPLTANGKVDKQQLPAPGPLKEKVQQKTPPVTVAEQLLARIWGDVLGIEEPDMTDNFFEAGGHSLKAAKMVAAIFKETGARLPLKAVFTAASLGELVKVVENVAPEKYEPIPVYPFAGDYPLSHSQKRLWIAAQLADDPAIFNMTGVYDITGTLNTAAFGQALSLMVEQHDILKTCFSTLTGEPRQVVARDKQGGFALKLVNYEGVADAAAKADALFAAESGKPFDLAAGPLLRATLCALAPDQYRFMISFHHILLDGWSIGLFIQEFAALYEACAGGRPVSPAKPPVQYGDFAAWQNARLQLPHAQTSKNYWQQQLAVLPSGLQLPLDRPRKAYLTNNGRQYAFAIEKELHAQLMALAGKSKVSLYVLVLSAIYITLSVFSEAEEIVLGTEAAEREHPDLQKMLGFFLNTIVLKTTVRKADTITQLIARVNEVLGMGLTHKDYPFDLLLHELDIPRAANRTPLFDVQVDYIPHLYQQGYEEGLINGQGFTMKYLPAAVTTSQYDITFLITDRADHLTVALVYNSDLFVEATIADMAARFKKSLQAIAENAAQTIEHITRQMPKRETAKKVNLQVKF